MKISDGFHQEARKHGTFDTTAPSGGEVQSLSSPVQAAVENDNGTRSVSVTFTDPKYDDLEAAKDVNTTKGFRLGWFAKNLVRYLPSTLQHLSMQPTLGAPSPSLFCSSLHPYPLFSPRKKLAKALSGRLTRASTASPHCCKRCVLPWYKLRKIPLCSM